MISSLKKMFQSVMVCSLIIIFQDTSFASCLDQGLLGFIKNKNSIEYLEKVFPICVSQKECDPAVKGLEKIKNIDPVRYAFFKGSALANGDCYKQDLKEAERNLLLCSKYSKTCRDALFNFYVNFAPNKFEYENFALSLAGEGNPLAYSFLADLNLDRNNIYNAYFWALAYYYTNDIAILNIEKWINNQRQYIIKEGGDPDSIPGLNINDSNVPNLIKTNKEIEPYIVRMGFALPPKLREKIMGMAHDFAASPKKPSEGKDELQDLANMYGVFGITTAKPTAKVSKRIKKITPPKRSISNELRKIQEQLAQIAI